jgi:Methyltransferase domain
VVRTVPCAAGEVSLATWRGGNLAASASMSAVTSTTPRKPFQGVLNIVRFNAPMFAVAALAMALAAVLAVYLPPVWQGWVSAVIALLLAQCLVALLASHWVYDRCGLYDVDWLKDDAFGPSKVIAVLHAGFDEISAAVQQRCPAAKVVSLDFYHAERHTEPSLDRARRAYPAAETVQHINTLEPLPFAERSVDLFIYFLSAHEVRSDSERAVFFANVSRCLAAEGRIVVIEHLRDGWNALVYSLGALHFHSARTWHETFAKAGLEVVEEQRVAGLLMRYVLRGGTKPSTQGWPSSAKNSAGESVATGELRKSF